MKRRQVALVVLASLAFLGTCSGIFGNLNERGPSGSEYHRQID